MNKEKSYLYVLLIYYGLRIWDICEGKNYVLSSIVCNIYILYVYLFMINEYKSKPPWFKSLWFNTEVL